MTIENPQRDALASFNFAQKYARYLPELKRRETWSEATSRVMTMHRTKLGERAEELSVELEEIELLINERRILGSQRSLQFGGDAVLAKHARSYNCTSCYVDHVDRFAQALYLLLCGAGVGYSVQKHHVAKLPPILDGDTLISKERVDRCIPDTIEGWADAFKGLVRSYTDPVTPLFAFDFSMIREKGAPISSCGGKAPGPEPLRVALARAETLLKERAGSALRPIDASDLMCILADCVLAGGVRRSALLCMFSPDDEEMIGYKSAPNWWDLYPYRARANISAMILRSDPDARAHFERIFKATRAYGEPAVIWCDSLEVAYNPCVEIGMCPTLIKYRGEVVDEYTIDMLEDSRRHAWELDGYTYETAFQFCNLCEINASAWRTIEDAERAVYLATILGMIQATYTGTDGDYLSDTATRAILERECLLGVSLTGLGSAPDWARESHLLEHLSTIARRTAEQSWERVGLPRPPARVTCVKPSGNAAVNLGCASGVHPEHSRRYIRRVQVPASSPIVQAFASANPQAVERSVWSASGDLCLAFAITAPEDALTRDDLSAVEFLSWVKQVQGCWVKRGTLRAQSVEGLTHNVSNTCTVNADEWDEVAETLLNGRAEFGGVSLLGASGDYDYPQAPFQAIRFPHEIAEDDPHREAKIEAYNLFCQLEAQYTPIDYSKIIEDDDNTTLMFESACAGGACEI